MLSRDAILDVVANRPLELFDRSVDALVVRLRRKIEPDPKAPRLIVTVPGEGSRFDGLAPALRGARADGAAEFVPPIAAELPAADPAPEAAQASVGRGRRPRWPRSLGRPEGRPSADGLWSAPTALAAVLVLALFAASAALWHSDLAPRWLGGPAAEDKLATAPRLSIVVLPFDNAGGDKQQDYFADGITDDLTTDLSHLDGSFVISRGTAFTYKGKPNDAKTIGRELGVRYLMEGSVRRVGDKVEVNARLVSTETGAQVWADRFEGERAKLGELQVDVVSRLANSLGVELVKAEALRAMRERPNNPDATDLAMRGEAILNSIRTKGRLNEAIKLFERARALDPNNVQATIGLASALTWRAANFWSDDRAGDMVRGSETIDAALALQPSNASAHLVKAWNFFANRKFEPAIAEAVTAIAEDRNNADAHAVAGFWKMFLGHSEDGFAGVETALRLSPRDSQVPSWQFYMCHLHAHLAQWEQAIEWCEKSIAGQNPWVGTFVDLAAANAWAGHTKEAKDTVARLLKAYPGYTVQDWASIHWSDDPTFNAQYARIVEGLRKAGLPEGMAKKAN